jgi:hypothetical protein
MRKIIAALVVTAVTIITLLTIIYARGNAIELLISQLNATIQAKALCEQKNSIYIREIALQNNLIEDMKIDNEKAIKTLLNDHKNSVKKWENEIKTAKNATCEEQLSKIDALHKKFYKERQ